VARRVLRLSGELDLATDEDLLTAFRSASNGSSEVIVDLSELQSIDSTGIRAFVTIARRRHLAVSSFVHPGEQSER
jgi:anti-anti-sigma factor